MSQNILSDNILDYGKEDVLKFIQTTIRQRNNVKDILDNINYVTGKVEVEVEEDPVLGTVINPEEDVREDRSSQGFYYERLWDLCIKFGVTDLTIPVIKGKLQTSHIIDGNSNGTVVKLYNTDATAQLIGMVIKNGDASSGGGLKISGTNNSKIKNLQNQNRTLEQMAQAIFKSWFVDFDNITEFEDSEIGKKIIQILFIIYLTE